MKLNYYLAVVLMALLGSCNSGSKVGSAEVNGDTIVTESGLKYIYITKGDGKEIERGSEVSAYLGLKIEDSLVWNTDAMPDSLFVFRAGVSTLIQGFTEMAFLLREGDEVVAIMPDSIAYGEAGAQGFVPPNSTIVYEPFRIVKVGDVKLPLSEFLIEEYEANGMDGMLSLYETATTTADSNKYMGGLVEVFRFWEELTKQERHEEAASVAAYFGDKENEIRLKYSAVLSYESMGNLQQAKDSLLVIEKEMPGAPIIVQKLKDLDTKLGIEPAE